jgi:hypothetical protein
LGSYRCRENRAIDGRGREVGTNDCQPCAKRTRCRAFEVQRRVELRQDAVLEIGERVALMERVDRDREVIADPFAELAFGLCSQPLRPSLLQVERHL